MDELVGNAEVKRYLKRAIGEGRLGQALLFSGPEGVGKLQFAVGVAALLLNSKEKVASGNHPDLRIYRPEGKLGQHSIESMRRLTEQVGLAPYEGKWKVFVIDDADRLNVYSANALLKTFEEPPRDTVIILVTSNPEALLPTIRSRCRQVMFRAVAQQEIAGYLEQTRGLDATEANRIAALCDGSIGGALRSAAPESRQRCAQFLDFLGRPGQGYAACVAAIGNLVESIEALKKEEEARTGEEHVTSEMNAVQRDGTEKEIAGQVSMAGQAAIEELLTLFLAYHRDAEALQLGATVEHCLVLKSLPAQRLRSLDAAQEKVDEIRLMIQRSGSLQYCLEHLFLTA